MARSLEDAARSLADRLNDQFEPYRRRTFAVITSVQYDDAGRVIGAMATVDGLPNQPVAVSVGTPINAGDVWEVSNMGGRTTPSWTLVRRLAAVLAVPQLLVLTLLPTPTGLALEDGLYQERPGEAVNVWVYASMHTLPDSYGPLSYQLQYCTNERDDPVEITVVDVSSPTALEVDVSSSDTVLPREASDILYDFPRFGRIQIGAELVDYEGVSSATGTSGTGTAGDDGTPYVEDSGADWDVDEWKNFALYQSGGSIIARIVSNTATRLYLDRAGASAAYTVYPAFVGCTRGAASTTPAAHSDGDGIVRRSVGTSIAPLPQATGYNFRCRALRVDGAQSAWSAWNSVTTESETLPVPTGLDASHTLIDGMTAQLFISWHTTVENQYGELGFDIEVRADDPDEYDQVFLVRDDRLYVCLQAAVTASSNCLPHDLDATEGKEWAPAGRLLIDEELIDYTAMTYGTGDSGTGTGSLNTLTDSGKSWDDDEWINWALVDSAGTVFKITDNGATTLTVVGTPASGAYTIYPAFVGLTRGAGSTSAAAHVDDSNIYAKTEWLRLGDMTTRTYYIRARTHRIMDDKVSDWTSWISEAAQDTSAPAIPNWAHTTYGNGYTNLWFDTPSLSTTPDLAGFELWIADDLDGTNFQLYQTSGPEMYMTISEDPGWWKWIKVRSFDQSENYSNYSSTYSFLCVLGASTPQILTNADWELGSISADTIDDWYLDLSGSTANPIEDYGMYGYNGSKGIAVVQQGDSQPVSTVFRWPGDITKHKVLGVDGAFYRFSIYVKGSLFFPHAKARLIAHDGVSDIDYLPWLYDVPDLDGMLQADWEQIDEDWKRLSWIGVWTPTDSSHKYVGVSFSIIDAGLYGAQVLAYGIDRPMFAMGPITPWTLTAVPIAADGSGIRMDTTGILADELNIDEAGEFEKVVLTDGITAPSGTSGRANIYVDTSDSKLKVRHGTGTPLSLQEQDTVGGDKIDSTRSSAVGPGGLIYSGTGWTTLRSVTITVPTGYRAFVYAFCYVYGNEDQFVQARLTDGTTTVITREEISSAGESDGHNVSLGYLFTNTGSKTFQFQANKSSNSGLIYAKNYYLTVLVFEEK